MQRLLAVSAVIVLGSTAVPSFASAIAAGEKENLEPDMVQPELLPQGFVIIVEDVPREATQDQPIYLASSINGWNPADPEFVLTPRSDTRWQIIIDEVPANTTVAFKFTMGGWDREELDGNGESVANRSFPLVDRSKLGPNERPVLEFSIPEWRVPVALSEQVRESGVYRSLNVTGDVRRLEVRGGAGGAEALTRDLQVWLPEGYLELKNANRDYPVLYMMDGQNVFEQLPGIPGEWGVDETAQRLIADGRVEPMIIVAVPHAGEHRLREYLPVGQIQGNSADGPAFVSWMQREVMPRVERSFRVKTGAENTAIGGASLGGAISLFAATQHSEVFGKAIVESLPMLYDNGKAAREYLDSVSTWPGHVFIGMGGREVSNNGRDAERNAAYVDWAKELDQRLANAGLDSSRRRLRIDADANHNEIAWSQRFPEALEFLFPAGN